MKLNKIMVIIGLLIIGRGLIFTALSHDAHYLVASAFTLGNHDHSAHSHDEHKMCGYVFSLIGLAVAVAGWKIVN